MEADLNRKECQLTLKNLCHLSLEVTPIVVRIRKKPVTLNLKNVRIG